MIPRNGWERAIHPRDWAAMTRMHESSHVTASEALDIPVTDVWVNTDRNVAHGGQYRNGAGDAQLQSVVYLIGAEGGAQELRERGYDERLAHGSTLACGYADREIVRNVVIPQAAAAGYRLDPDIAYDNALQILHSPGFQDASHNVAQALADRGDRLTGADVRAAMGGFQLDGSLWLPTSAELNSPDREPGFEPPAPSPVPAGPATDQEHDLDDEFDL
jgi:hypothetical protein